MMARVFYILLHSFTPFGCCISFSPELIAHVSPFPFLPFGMGVMCLHGFDYWDGSGKVNRTQENHGESFIFLLTLEALQGRI